MSGEYKNEQFAGSIRIGKEWLGCHVLRRTKLGWYEWRVDWADGSTESGVSQGKDVRLGEHPQALEDFGA